MYDVQDVISNMAQHKSILDICTPIVISLAFVQYLAAIWIGFRDKSHAIPIAANTFFFAHDTTFLARGDLFSIVWIPLQIIVAYQIIAYSRREVGIGETIATALGSYAAITAGMYILVWWAEDLLIDPLHIKLFAVMFGICSFFNIPMLLRRGSRKGQSLILAWALFIQAPICFFIQQPLWTASMANRTWYLAGIGLTVLAGVYLVMLNRAPAYGRADLTRR